MKKQKRNYRKDASALIAAAKDVKNKDVNIINKAALSPTPLKKLTNLFYDGWTNVITGLGTAQDKTQYTQFRRFEIIDEATLSEIWIAGGLGHKIVSIVANDMTREWLTIPGDTENKIIKNMDKIGAETEINLALKWKRLFGGGICVLGINDSRDIEEPVNINNIQSVDWIRTFDKSDVILTDINFNLDIQSENYKEVEFYTISPRWGAPFNVHRDRVLVFRGIRVPERVEVGEFWYWGMSVLQVIWDELKDIGAGRHNTSKILYEFIIGIYKFSGLSEMLAEGNEQLLRNRMNAIDLSKSMIQSVLIDTEEDYSRQSATLSGLPELLDRYMMFVSGVCDIPVTLLFGRSPAGMNATGESDKINYNNMIRANQKNELKPQLLKLARYINAANNFIVPDDDLDIEFNSLTQETEKEKVEKRKLQTDIDVAYINSGVLDPEEIRQSRFGGDSYSIETVLDDQIFKANIEEQKAFQESLMKAQQENEEEQEESIDENE